MNRYRVKPGSKIDLSEWDPNDTSAFDGDKGDARKAMTKLARKLEELQELLYAEGKHKVLVVLQAMDSGGKDGTIRHVFGGMNPQGAKVTSFKKPSERDLSRDYLWRAHRAVSAKGEIMIFNRSHYEDVLIVRVHDLVPDKVWSRRYRHINDFERMLADEGTTILKFYLHIDPDEQKKRFQDRLDCPDKRWKFRLGDIEERRLWPAYMHAYEDVLSKTSKKHAPWYIVPANRKWYRNLVIATILTAALKGLDMGFPAIEEDLNHVTIE